MNKKISKKTTCFFLVLFALFLALLLASCDCTHEWGEWETITAATCGSEGAKQRSCVKCEENETNTIPATGAHTFGEWEILNTPTYDLDGLKQRRCNCGTVESIVLPCVGILRTENFEITVPMMSYMVYSEYHEWVNFYQGSGFMQYVKIPVLTQAPGGFLVYGILIAVMNKLTEKKGGVKKKSFSCEGCPSSHLCNKTSCSEVTELAAEALDTVVETKEAEIQEEKEAGENA